MDHDRLFKVLLITFFTEFVELLLPDVAKYMDRNSIEFLDKEIFTDIASGERHEVDLVVKVRFRGRPAFFLIHVESQAWSQEEFARRMFEYFALLYRKYRLPILPVVIFSFDKPVRPEPDRFRIDFPGFRVLDFGFRVIQLNRLDWRDYIRNPNPVASALMAKMRIAPQDRPKVKLECLRMLASLKLDKARSALIGTFMDSYLKLTAAEMVVYNRELRATSPKQREHIMQMTNSWVEKGKAEGRTEGRMEGRLEGRLEGRRDLISRQLRRRFGRLPAGFSKRLLDLSDSQVDKLAEAIFDFEGAADAVRWLDSHSRSSGKRKVKN
jgi:predicted transposase YdaD